ncbi:MAG: hypothetical protein R3B91_20670 [Planctomycetaceae bacterium]
MSHRHLLKSVCLSGWFLLHLCWVAPVALAEIHLDYLMDSDPNLPFPETVLEVDPQLVPLWIEALGRPEIDMQRMAAETIARGHERGIPDLVHAVPRLEEILTSPTSHPAARFAAARALIVLESRDSAAKLFEASEIYGADLRQLVESALAAWEDPSARDVWAQRLGSRETHPRDLIQAIRGLGALREQSVLPTLLAIVNEPTENPGIRLVAATAAGQIAETGLEQDAERLASNPRTTLFVNQLCAVRLLAQHASEAAQQVLISMAVQDEPAVAAAALERLNQIAPSLVLPLAETAIQSSDPQVRRQGALCMLQLPSPSLIAPLSHLLGDPNPSLRREVSEGLYQLSSQPELNEPICEAAMNVLAGDRWQGQEQAATLLGALEHQPAASRLVELLDSPREEVRLPVSWALRKVAVPETIPAIIEHATLLTERRKSVQQPGLDEQVAYLFEALGVLHAEDATSLLMQYVPKRIRSNDHSRSSAIWALGLLNQGKRNPELEAALTERIMDFAPQPEERLVVKEMCAIALGRMQAIDQAGMMKQFAESGETKLSPSVNEVSENNRSVMRLDLALRWAVRELTGEEMPTPPALIIILRNWFLEPVP